MKKPILLFLFLSIFCWQCEQTSAQKVEKNDKKITENVAQKQFLRSMSVLSDEETLNKALDSLKLQPWGIYEYALTIQDPLVKARLIKSVYLNNKRNADAAKDDFWADIRYNLYEFTDLIHLLREDRRVFLDIGCGSGQKLYGALCMGFDKTFGIEYSEKSFGYVKDYMKEFISKGKAEVRLGDALAVENAYYAKADFLYTYSPMKDNEKMASLFKKVMDSMKDGAVFLEVRMVYFRELKAKIGYKVPQHKGFLAIKKENGKYYYKTIFNKDDWEELEKE